MSKCTVVSLYPGIFNEKKPGLHPSEYKIAPPKDGDISILVVKDAIHYVDVGEGRPVLRMTITSDNIARALVEDFIRSKYGVSFELDNPEHYEVPSHPGIFFVEGEHTKDSILKTFPDKIAKARESQIAWFKALIALSDDDWSKKQSPRMITDDAKFAARALGLERPWLITMNDKPVYCKACKSQVMPGAIICGTCKMVLDPEAYKGLKFADDLSPKPTAPVMK